MRDDLEQQEQIDELKAFWSRWGQWITTGLTVVLLAVAAFNGWQWWQTRQAGEAVLVYDKLTKASEAKDAQAIKDISGALLDKFGRTEYATLGAFVAARGLVDVKEPAEAKRLLQWVIDEASSPEYKALARVRLAAVLIDEAAYDTALKLLENQPDPAFASLFADRRGDVYLAQGQKQQAREAYRQAVAALPSESMMRELVQTKLDMLGES